MQLYRPVSVARPSPVRGAPTNSTHDLSTKSLLTRPQPRDADVFTGYSCTDGRVSTINCLTGTKFFQALAKQMEKNFMRKCLETIFTMVTDEVAEIEHMHGKYMHVPQKVSTLRMPLYFTCKPVFQVSM